MKISFHPYGEQAILLQWEQRIDPEINAEVIQLSRRISREKLPGVSYLIPAYCSLTVGYAPNQIGYKALCSKIHSLAEDLDGPESTPGSGRRIVIPVCYEGECAPDLEWMSRHTGLSPDQIVQLHTATPFRVYMLGFLPGFPYLGTLPKVLEAPRKANPRLRVPAGSVGLAGLQTGIYPLQSPGGWQIIGRTPWKIFDPEREEPFLLQAGDEVGFEAIGLEGFYGEREG